VRYLSGVLTLEILNPGCKEAGKNSEQWRISDRPKSKPTEVALKLVGCQLSGKREEGTGNREQGRGNREEGTGKREVVRSQESGVRSQLSVVREK
jgi:hypothetical protein